MFLKALVTFLSTTALFCAQLITPIPLDSDYDEKKALLGKKLFFDTRLSSDNTISCASCHMLNDGGDDNIAVSFGVNGHKGTRNSPTVLNARYNKSQFWDGSAKNLHVQAMGPIHNPNEMGSSLEEIVKKLKKDSYYLDEFRSLYKNGITDENIIDAIVEFEDALTTPNAKFDKYLRGDKDAISKSELNGFKLFKEYGCISCHNGVNIGGNLLQKIGAVERFDTVDYGLYHITQDEDDKFYFKVPSLRNVELTAPYFHNGKVKTLEEAVDKMIQHQVGFMIQESEKSDIINFLKTLTGQTPKILKDKE